MENTQHELPTKAKFVFRNLICKPKIVFTDRTEPTSHEEQAQAQNTFLQDTFSILTDTQEGKYITCAEKSRKLQVSLHPQLNLKYPQSTFSCI